MSLHHSTDDDVYDCFASRRDELRSTVLQLLDGLSVNGAFQPADYESTPTAAHICAEDGAITTLEIEDVSEVDPSNYEFVVTGTYTGRVDWSSDQPDDADRDKDGAEEVDDDPNGPFMLNAAEFGAVVAFRIAGTVTQDDGWSLDGEPEFDFVS